jgi:hypothetical protein
MAETRNETLRSFIEQASEIFPFSPEDYIEQTESELHAGFVNEFERVLPTSTDELEPRRVNGQMASLSLNGLKIRLESDYAIGSQDMSKAKLSDRARHGTLYHDRRLILPPLADEAFLIFSAASRYRIREGGQKIDHPGSHQIALFLSSEGNYYPATSREAKTAFGLGREVLKHVETERVKVKELSYE